MRRRAGSVARRPRPTPATGRRADGINRSALLRSHTTCPDLRTARTVKKEVESRQSALRRSSYIIRQVASAKIAKRRWAALGHALGSPSHITVLRGLYHRGVARPTRVIDADRLQRFRSK